MDRQTDRQTDRQAGRQEGRGRLVETGSFLFVLCATTCQIGKWLWLGGGMSIAGGLLCDLVCDADVYKLRLACRVFLNHPATPVIATSLHWERCE